MVIELRPEGIRKEEIINNKLKLFEQKIEYMHRRMLSMIEVEVHEQFKKEGLREFMVKVTRKFLKENLEELVETVISSTLVKFRKKIHTESKIVKDLCLSIDSDIKHVIRGLNCSSRTDDVVKIMIEKEINNLSNKILLEKGEGYKLITEIK